MNSLENLTSDMFDFANESENEEFMDLYTNHVDTEIYDYITSVLDSINIEWRKNKELGYNAPEHILGIISLYEDLFSENKEEGMEQIKIEIDSAYENWRNGSESNKWMLSEAYMDQIYGMIQDDNISEEEEDKEYNRILDELTKKYNEEEYWIIGTKAYNEIESEMKKL